MKKTIQALEKKQIEVVLDETDLRDDNASDWNDLPPTLYTLFSILKSDTNNLLIHLNGFYGISAAKTLTRFAYMDKHLLQFVKEITNKEQKLLPNAILAEIVHLPESRLGNVINRPHIRHYEIPYLAYSDLSSERIIEMSDLFLSIRQGRICLRSKKLNKEIIPRLTNAHNYHKSYLPAYRFLCDIQMQYGKKYLIFDWGYLKNEFHFFPRVKYRNTILSLVTWKIKIEDITRFFVLEDELLIKEVDKWRIKMHFPLQMLLADYDMELLVDWRNLMSVKAFLKIIKNREIIYLKEFLYDPENSVVKDKEGNAYMNECIIAFYKSKK